MATPTSYTAPNYEAPSFLTLFGGVPRFGHTKDISRLILGTNIADYCLGLLLIPSLIVGIAIIYFGLLLLFKRLGNKVGWCSGTMTHSLLERKRTWSYYGTSASAMTMTGPKIEHDGINRRIGEEETDTARGARSAATPPTGVRVTALLSTVGMVVCACLYCTYGIDGFYRTFDILRDGIEEINIMGANVTDLADSLVTEGKLAQDVRDDLQELVNNGGICSGLGVGITSQIDQELQSLITALDTLYDVTDENLPTSGEPIPVVEGIQTANSTIDRVLDIAEGETWKARFLAIPLVIASLWIMIGILLAWFFPQCGSKRYFCVQSWFTIPLTVICVLVVSLIVAICAAALVMNSDLCTPPEATVSKILDGSTTLDATQVEIVDYYILNGCEGKVSELDEIKNTIEEYDGIKIELTTVRDEFKYEQSEYERLCLGCILPFQECPGAEGSLDDVGDALDKLYDLTMKLDVSANRISELTSCERINSIYIDVVHDGICTELPRAFHLVFVSLLFGSMIFGLGLLTTRAGAFPPQEGGDYLEMTPTSSDEYDLELMRQEREEEHYKSDYQLNHP